MTDRSKYQRAVRGDIAYNMMRMWQGALGVVPTDGLVSPSYVVLRPFDGTVARYYAYLFRTTSYMREVEIYSRGIVPDRNRLYWESFKQMPSVFPPFEEQKLIVRYLDTFNALTYRLVHGKLKLISLLQEQRKVITQQAVRQGINSSVRFKSSSFPWLGHIPQHWEMSRVKTEFRCLNRHRIPLSSTERGRMTVRAYPYYGASGIIDYVDDFLFDDDLLLIAEDGANLVLRNLPLAIIAHGKYWVNNHAHILRPRRGNLAFLAAVMESLNYQPWISGAAQPKLTQDRLMSIPIAVPSSDEQADIMAAVDNQTVNLRKAVDALKQEITCIREFQARLIAEVVTGALDVRTAPSFPEAAEEIPPFDVREATDNAEYTGEEEAEIEEAVA
jgi:type I restriction enzyme S subunit